MIPYRYVRTLIYQYISQHGAMFFLSLLKQWCYAQSMFIVDGPSAEENIFPGVKNIYGDSRNRVVYIRYYQWVTLCLLMQAACFQVIFR